MKLIRFSKAVLKSKTSLAVGLGAGMLAYSGVSASQPSAGVGKDATAPASDDVHDRAVTAADGIAPDSGPTIKCAPGYYYCWSNVQQKSVCTTRKCYGAQPQPQPKPQP